MVKGRYKHSSARDRYSRQVRGLTMPHFSSLFAAETYHKPALRSLGARFLNALRWAACASSSDDGASSA